MSPPALPDAAAAAAAPAPEAAGGSVRYRIRHRTAYRYGQSVALAHHLLFLQPRALAHQRCLAQQIAIEPVPQVIDDHVDCFGNPVRYLAIQTPHDGLVVDSWLEVETAPGAALDLAATPPWETLRELIVKASDEGARTAASFAFASPRVPLLRALADYTRRSFTPGRPVGAAATDLMARIHRDFAFDPRATTVSATLDEVLVARRGVCQDLAHVGVGCLRALGLSARYVSGYLRTFAPPGQERLRGVDASHAWLAVWCGGEQWLDLDPTNNRPTSTDHVTVAWGRDFEDVSPVRGVLFGGGRHSLAVMVDVDPVRGESPAPGDAQAAVPSSRV
jgi:transglutaminase-like putative cysteine protease